MAAAVIDGGALSALGGAARGRTAAPIGHACSSAAVGGNARAARDRLCTSVGEHAARVARILARQRLARVGAAAVRPVAAAERACRASSTRQRPAATVGRCAALCLRRGARAGCARGGAIVSRRIRAALGLAGWWGRGALGGAAANRKRSNCCDRHRGGVCMGRRRVPLHRARILPASCGSGKPERRDGARWGIASLDAGEPRRSKSWPHG